MKQADVAGVLHMHVNTIGRIEKSGRGEEEKVRQLAEYLDVDLRSGADESNDATFDARLSRLRGGMNGKAVPVEVREFLALLAKAKTPEERERLFELASLLDRLLP